MRNKVGDVSLQKTVVGSDITAVQRLIKQAEDTEFFRDRRARNVAPPPPEFSRDEFWHVLLGCLLTTQQRSTKGSPVDRFLQPKSFPLTLVACQKTATVRRFVLEALRNFGGIRRGVTVSKQAADNLKRLNRGLWKEAEEWFELLKQQRLREAQISDRTLERKAAHWADASFAGLGPKQSRNLWQWLGLARYEIPLDSRVTDWVNENLSINVDAKRLGQLKYYESALEYIQTVCEKANVLPCELDGAAFDYDDVGLRNGRFRQTTDPAFLNQNGQITIRNTGLPGTDHNQYVYQLACSHCGQVYGANGSDIHDRKCPECQSGRPGLKL